VNSGSGTVSVTFRGGLVSEEAAPAEQVGAGASVHLSFEHLDAVDVAFDDAGAPGEAEPAGDGVLVGSQAGDEGAKRGLAGCEGGGHPWLEQLRAAALVHDDGEVADAGGDGGQFRGCGEDGVEAGLVGVGEPVGRVMIQAVTVRAFGGAGDRAGTAVLSRKRAR